MRRTSSLFLAMFAVVCVTGPACAEVKEPPPKVQLAILLDTSNSMDNLIAQAKSQLWKIVNEFANCKRDGKRPVLEVALYEYGNNGLSAETGHIRQVTPLTTDLDVVSEQLFALTTNGGQEYCGAVIEAAVKGLSWSSSPRDLKLIYIAGNEPFTQGGVDYRLSCKAAIEHSILVNTIHCGDHATGESTGWRDGAVLADGSYASIDLNQALVAIAAPQDEKIAQLGVELNSTYVAYGGAAGTTGMARQTAQDSNSLAAAAADSAVQRALFKASCNYLCGSWDLVDAVRLEKVKLADLKPDQLPKELRELSEEQRKAHLDKKYQQRVLLQKQIGELNVEREKFVEKERERLGGDNGKALDDVVISTLRDQARAKDFMFEAK